MWRVVGKITPCLKLVRIMLEIWYVSTHTCKFSEDVPFSPKTLLILLTSAFKFLQKNHHFLAKVVTLLKAILELC